MSEILDIAHDMARDLLKAGALDEMTMRKVNALCLPPKRAFGLEDIRRIRLASHVSQAVFAAILGIGKTTIQQWERGQKRPSGPAQRLLDLIDRKGLAALG
jgi:putative transcriptional regulator